MLVIEAVPPDLAKVITRSVPIPTIGIAAGTHCDGQILVHYDMLGLTPKRPYVKPYGHLSQQILNAIDRYQKDVIKER